MNKSTLINEILKKINFKIHPEKDIRKDYIYRIKKRLYKLTGNEKKFIDSNTKFENISKADLDAIQQLLLVDTMSRVSVGFIINQISKNLKSDGVYINIGVWRGFSMFAGMFNTQCEVYGVDNFSHDYKEGNPKLDNLYESSKARNYFFKYFDKIKNKEKHFFFDMDYKIFFKSWEKKNKLINFYYYDGEHSYKNQYENLIIVKDYLAKDAIILVDDYNMPVVERATLDFIHKFNNSFKIIKELKTGNRFIHPTYGNGLIFIQKI